MNDNNESKGLLVQEPRDASTAAWVLLQRQCDAFLASGLLPDHVWKGFEPNIALARALTIASKGKELGITPLQSFTSITVIQGKPCLSAELMLALIYQRVKGAKVTFVTPADKQTTECTIEMQRPGGNAMQFKFTIEDAKRAELKFKSDKGLPTAWAKYPAAMLRARAISAGARAVFPDCIMGCYTPEEMGSEIIDVEEMDSTVSIVEQKANTEQPKAPDAALSRATVERGYPPFGPTSRCTDKQKEMVWGLCEDLKMDEGDLMDWTYGAYRVLNLSDLTLKECSEVIEVLMDRKKKANATR